MAFLPGAIYSTISSVIPFILFIIPIAVVLELDSFKVMLCNKLSSILASTVKLS